MKSNNSQLKASSNMVTIPDSSEEISKPQQSSVSVVRQASSNSTVARTPD